MSGSELLPAIVVGSFNSRTVGGVGIGRPKAELQRNLDFLIGMCAPLSTSSWARASLLALDIDIGTVNRRSGPRGVCRNANIFLGGVFTIILLVYSDTSATSCANYSLPGGRKRARDDAVSFP